MTDIPEDVRKLADAMQKQSVIDGTEIIRLRGELASANAQIDILKDMMADREKRGEPVAWQHRLIFADQSIGSTDWHPGRENWSEDGLRKIGATYEERPLYASAPPAPAQLYRPDVAGLPTNEEMQELAAQVGVRFVPFPDKPAPAQPVAIKPLIWEDFGGGFFRAEAPLFGNIRVEHYSARFCVSYSVPGFSNTLVAGEFATADEAQAAAQAYYETRIRSALVETAQPVDVDAVIDPIDCAVKRLGAAISQKPHTKASADEILQFNHEVERAHASIRDGLAAAVRSLKGVA